ncbi:MAG: hypothetical protein HDR09_09280 [Lachnospiraceae bacterium]|nr:hypothetical protein [Lachnospiraceae bacterium]
MRKRIALIMVTVSVLLMAGCGDSKIMSESYSLTLGELKELEDRELIGNQIPQWVSDADWNKPLYVVSSSNIEHFDAYALENFPDYYDDGWTQKQSDTVYLGQGIEMFALDDATQINRIIYYPVILNGVIVGGYQVCEQLENQEISVQASPLLANELNLMMDLTSEETPLILGYNNNNTIGIIGDTCYVLDIDHVFHKNVSLDKISVIEYSNSVNAMEVLCTERTANMERNADTDVLLPLDGVTDDAASSSETQEPAKEEEWEDKALLEEYAAYGIEKHGDFYYYQGELVYLIKNQYPDSSVYSLNTDSTGTISIKVNRNAKGEITSVTYMTEEEVAKALPRILGGMKAAEYSDTNAEELADTFGILISLPVNSNWTVDSEYYLVDENNLSISYHDSIADADCTLLVSKNNNLNLPQAEYDETLNESWEGYTIGRQHIVVKVQHKKNDEKMVLATWKYNEYQFAIIGEDVNDYTPIPKVALYIINRLD